MLLLVIITPHLFHDVVALVFANTSSDTIGSRVQPFVIAHGTDVQGEAAMANVPQYSLISLRANGINLADLQALTPKEALHIPKAL